MDKNSKLRVKKVHLIIDDFSRNYMNNEKNLICSDFIEINILGSTPEKITLWIANDPSGNICFESTNGFFQYEWKWSDEDDGLYMFRALYQLHNKDGRFSIYAQEGHV